VILKGGLVGLRSLALARRGGCSRLGWACSSASWHLHYDQAYILLERSSRHPRNLLETRIAALLFSFIIKKIWRLLAMLIEVERCRQL
jgi:hypothetical protein